MVGKSIVVKTVGFVKSGPHSLDKGTVPFGSDLKNQPFPSKIKKGPDFNFVQR
jgi:hypothetical protein